MRKLGTVAGVVFAGLALWGCGEGDIDSKAEAAAASNTIIEVQKDGVIVETIAEDFTADYYNEDELRNMVLSEVAEFNKNSEQDISVDKFENKDGIIKIVMKYPSAEAYTDYNSSEFDNKQLFCGTVKEAYDEGYSLDVTLQSAGNEEESIGKDELLGMGEKHILISNVPFRVQTFGKILYLGDNVISLEKNKADMETDENGDSLGKYYIVFK
ncbi:MAG: hypothetical protein GX235_04035 [Clostridiales bacterium]|nr:hypothetical protein [Clostridiales bacterium]